MSWVLNFLHLISFEKSDLSIILRKVKMTGKIKLKITQQRLVWAQSSKCVE